MSALRTTALLVFVSACFAVRLRGFDESPILIYDQNDNYRFESVVDVISASGATGASGVTGGAFASGASGSTGAAGKKEDMMSTSQIASIEANKAQCQNVPEKQFKACMKLLKQLNLKLTEVVAAGESANSVELPSVGSSVDKAKFICGSQRNFLNAKQLQMCDTLKDKFTASMEAIVNNDIDGGFCRMYSGASNKAPCQALMSEIISKLANIAFLSDPVLVVPTEGSPLDQAKELCEKGVGYLNDLQKTACNDLKTKIISGQEDLGITPKKPVDPCAAVKNNTDAYTQCVALVSGKPVVVVAPPSPNATVPTPVMVAPAPAAAKSAAFCDNVLQENMEQCRKWLTKTRYAILAIAAKGGLDVNSLEAGGVPLNGKSAKEFVKDVCDKVTSEAETAECKNLQADIAKDTSALLGGPVGPGFAANKKADNTTAPAPAAAPAVEERVSICASIDELSPIESTYGKECDMKIKAVKKLVADALTAAGKTVIPSKKNAAYLDQALDVCTQLENIDCANKIAEYKNSLNTQLALLQASATGISGATGSSATGGATGGRAQASVSSGSLVSTSGPVGATTRGRN